MMFDYHIHPNYSCDAEGSIDDFCQAAIAKGVREIAFTTHLDTDYKAEDCVVRVKEEMIDTHSGVWLEDYENTIRTAAERYLDDDLVVLLGAELDIYPGVIEKLPKGFTDVEWDLIIGSVHLIDHQAISLKEDAEEIFSKHSVEELGETYFSIVLDTIETSMINILGHLDLYRRFGEDFYGPQIHELWKPHTDELANRMKKFNVGFEVNTSSWRKGQHEPLPSINFIKALVERGVDTITVGSDAHSPNDVGADIDRALALLGNCCGIKPSRFRGGTKL
ncbi:MAG: histidinol-phosphatase [Candidatus Thorarchaeota archaeon]|nr:histidinol-phosphatase [Candidatus Thorarchaeota archaeon]